MRDEYVPTLRCDYTGRSGSFFKLSLVTTFLTIITVGFYRFWERTRIRRYLWSAIRPGGDSLEYLGTGLEKLLGFLIAVAFLAVYLGIFQLGLSFVGLSFFTLPEGPKGEALQVVILQLTVLALLPFIFYAQYRARRYMLSRTRWRGIRFGADKAAWGYVLRCFGHGFLTIISLGILLPRQTFYLEQYKVDRTWYGDTQFRQDGRWTKLYPAMTHIVVAILIGISAGALAYAGSFGLAAFLAALAYFWFFIGLISYAVRTWTILADHKILGVDVRFASTPSTATIIVTYVVGAIGIGVVSAAIGFLAFLAIGGFSVQVDPMQAMLSGDVVLMVQAFLTYLILFGMIGVLSNVFIMQPILRHYVLNTVIINPEGLNQIGQREQDDFAEADGFADALDIGAGL